jgi:dihydroflavonol-4-reductase
VAEVARTHADALTRGAPGRRYILGGENLTLKEILDLLSEISGIPAPKVRIPFAAAAVYAFLEESITGRILRREPRATLEEVRMGRKKMFASSDRAERELGFRVVPVRTAMAAAVEWYRANGYSPKP